MLSNTFSQASFLGSTSGDHNAGPTRQHPVLLEVSPISRSSSSSSRSNSSSGSGSGSGAKRKILPDLPTEPVSTHRIRFAIREFASLAHPRGSFVETGSHRLRGKNWRLRVYPRGHGQSRSDAVLVSWCLVIGDDNDNDNDNSDGDSDGNGNGDAPTVSYTNTGTNTGSNGDRDPSSSGNDDNDNDDDDNAAHDDDDDDDTFQFAFAVRDWAMVPSPWYELNDPTRGYRYGYGIMGHHRSRLLRTGLDADGTLVVDAELRFFSAKHGHRHKRPKQQVRSRFHVHVHNRGDDLGRQLWSNLSDTFDVAFVVEGRLFRAHSCVLAARAETLLELVEINEDEDEDEDEDQDITGTAARFSAPPIPIPIAGTDPDVFGALLEYAYTSDDAGARDFIDRATDPRATAWDLLVSADRWGCTSLKRLVESVLAEEEEEKEGEDGGGAGFLSPSNCCDVLLRADALSCPLLKKRALDMIASDPMAAMVQRVGGRGGGGEPSPAAEHTTTTTTTTGWDRLRESPRLLSELFVHTANRSLSSSSREEREQEQKQKPPPDVESLGDRFSETGFGTDGTKQRMVRDWLEHEQWRSSTGR